MGACLTWERGFGEITYSESRLRLLGHWACPRIMLLNVLSRFLTPHVSLDWSRQAKNLHWSEPCVWMNPRPHFLLCLYFNQNHIPRRVLESSWWCSKGCPRKLTTQNDKRLVGQVSAQNLAPSQTEGQSLVKTTALRYSGLCRWQYTLLLSQGENSKLVWGAEVTSC